jgi:hypothetical protein
MSSAGVPYSFGGQLACEACVRDNYPGASEDEIAEELRCRGNDAFRLIANEDKRRRKAVTPSDNHFCDMCGGSHLTENCREDF